MAAARSDFAEVCRRLLKNPTYISNFSVAFLERKLPHSLETMVWHYAAGKPHEQIDHRFPDGLGELHTKSERELADRARALALALESFEEARESEEESETTH